jgi:hypothetical protein
VNCSAASASSSRSSPVLSLRDRSEQAVRTKKNSSPEAGCWPTYMRVLPKATSPASASTPGRDSASARSARALTLANSQYAPRTMKSAYSAASSLPRKGEMEKSARWHTVKTSSGKKLLSERARYTCAYSTE